MDKIRIYKNLKILEERKNVAFQGSLICDCKNEFFYISHTGKQTRGILAPFLVKKKRQLSIVCSCCRCGKEINLYDSTVDGLKPFDTPKLEYQDFSQNSTRAFKVVMSYNYFEKDYLTNRFAECIITLLDENEKQYVLFE